MRMFLVCVAVLILSTVLARLTVYPTVSWFYASMIISGFGALLCLIQMVTSSTAMRKTVIWIGLAVLCVAAGVGIVTLIRLVLNHYGAGLPPIF